MLAKSLNEMYFSQSALGTFETCQLKFRRRYLDGLFWPSNWGGDEEQREGIELGQTFHTLAQRYFARGEAPADTEMLRDPLRQWFARLTEFRPFQQQGLFLPEHELRLNENGIKLVAKFDLLYIAPTGRCVIYDWKTNPGHAYAQYQRNSWQTILYRYVFSKVGGVYAPRGAWKPEEIAMVYWNPRYPHEVEPLVYSQKLLEQDERKIQNQIGAIQHLAYENFAPTSNLKNCSHCEYNPICHGKRALMLELEEEDSDFDLDWEAVEGLSL